MADTPISGLPVRTLVTATDEITTLADGVNYRSPLSAVYADATHATPIHLIDLMTGAQKALLSTTGPYIDDILTAAMAQGTANLVPEIHFPFGTMRLANTVRLKKRVKLMGESGGTRGQNATLIYVDNDRDGFEFCESQHYPELGAYGSAGSYVEGLGILPSSTAGKIGSGIWIRSGGVTIKNCYFANWAEHGVKILGTTHTYAATPKENGNPAPWFVIGCRIGECRSHGLYINGNQPNAGLAVNLDIANNLGYGVFDSSFLGNTFVGNHHANNELGHWRSDDPNNQSFWSGNYTEGDGSPTSFLNGGNIVIGGTLGTAIRPIIGSHVNVIAGTNQQTPVTIPDRVYGKEVKLNLHQQMPIQVILDGDDVQGWGLPYANPSTKDLEFRHNVDATRVPLRLTTALSATEDEAATAATIPWAESTSYAVDNKVLSGSPTRTYVCVTAGVSASNDAWASGVAYTVGQMVTSSTAPIRLYRCTAPGTSTVGNAPTGTAPAADGALTWAHVMPVTPAWVTGITYAVGDQVANDGKVYACTVAGTSGDPAAWTPSTFYSRNSRVMNDGKRYEITYDRRGTSGPIPTVAAWQASHLYELGALVSNAGNTYRNRLVGTSSAGTPPTGTGTSITDGGCRWDWWTPGPFGTGTAGTLGITGVQEVLDDVTTDLWAPDRFYHVNTLCLNRGLTYRCVTEGTSATQIVGGTTGVGGPVGSASGITDGTVVWDAVAGGGPSVFKQGITWTYNAITGPSGTDSSIPDGTGALRWAYQSISTLPVKPTVLTGPNGTGRGQKDGTAVWDFQSIGPGQIIMPGTWAPTLTAGKNTRVDFLRLARRLQQQSITNGLAFTLTPSVSPHQTLYSGTMTADRAVTLSTTNAVAGTVFRITRTATGAFNLNVGTGPLKALAVNTWCEVAYDGTNYYLAAYGAL